MEKTKQLYFRHGDVILKRVDAIPANAAKQKHLTLAEGEVTGHSHRISTGQAALFKFDEKMYLEVTSKRSALVHEEHAKIELPSGCYEIFIQEDYSPEGWKKVQD